MDDFRARISAALKRRGTVDKEDSPIFQSLYELGFTCLYFSKSLRVGEVPLLRLLKVAG